MGIIWPSNDWHVHKNLLWKWTQADGGDRISQVYRVARVQGIWDQADNFFGMCQ